jgi:hypothetical protein
VTRHSGEKSESSIGRIGGTGQELGRAKEVRRWTRDEACMSARDV